MVRHIAADEGLKCHKVAALRDTINCHCVVNDAPIPYSFQRVHRRPSSEYCTLMKKTVTTCMR